MRIFISYHTPDGVVAKSVAEVIKAHRPTAELFFAPERLCAGAYWIPRLAQEIKNTHAFLLLIGKRVGNWQELEYLEAVRLARDTGKPLIVPVVMGDYAPGLPFFDQYHRLFFSEPASKEAMAAILKALDGASGVGAPPLWAQFNPYRGFTAFTSTDAAFFFGREGLTADILTAMQEEPGKALALIGNSGVGKSSLAQAGVIATLKRQEWPTGGAWPAALAESRSWLSLTIRPEDKPLKSLALTFTRLLYGLSADQDADAESWVRRFRDGAGFGDLMRAVKEKLAQNLACDAPRSFLLYIDQAEELYASTEREGNPDADANCHAEAFSRVIAEASRRADCHVLFSLRSDYYGRLQADEALFAVSRRVDVPPMQADALCEAIERPAVTLGVRFEPTATPGHLASNTAREAGALPFVAVLLSDMWREMQEREDGVIRFGERPEVFDISALLRQRADRYRTQYKPREDDLRRLFTLKLAQVSRSGDVIKRRARRAECSPEEWRIAEGLSAEEWRLVTLEGVGDEVTAEVAHEQILRSWLTLQSWVEERREFLTWKSDLEAARIYYENTPTSKETKALLTGLRLEVARKWFSSHKEDLAPEDRKFISDSIVEENEAEKTRARTGIVRLAGAGMIGAFTTLILEQVFGISFDHLLLYVPFAIVLLTFLGFLIVLSLLLPQTYQIADWLRLAEREMNSLLRGWGGEYGKRKDVVKERSDWLSRIPDTGDTAALADMGKVRMTAFLLRELYEGNVKNAQLKIFNEFANGGNPYIAPGIRQIVGYDQFDVKDVKNNGFPPDAGVDWFPLLLSGPL